LARLLAYAPEQSIQELLLRIEYLTAENRILRGQIKGRYCFGKEKRRHWPRSHHRLVERRWRRAATASPKRFWVGIASFIANNLMGRNSVEGRRPKVDQETERLVVQMAKKSELGYDDRRCLDKSRPWSIRSDGGQCPASARHFSSAEAKANGFLEGLYPLTLARLRGCRYLLPRPRCEVLPILSRPDQDGKCESASIASKKPESELVRRTLGEVGQRRMSSRLILFGESSLRRALQQYLEHYTGSATIRAKTIGFCSFAPRAGEHGSSTVRERLEPA